MSFPDSYDLMHSLVGKHIACEELPDNELPACTPEDRWERFAGGHTVEYSLFKHNKLKSCMS